MSTYFSQLHLLLENPAVFNQHCQKVKHPLVFSLKINYAKKQFRWSNLAVPYVQYKVFNSFDEELARSVASCPGSWCYTWKIHIHSLNFPECVHITIFPLYNYELFSCPFQVGTFKIPATSLSQKSQYSANCHSIKIKVSLHALCSIY